MEGKMFKWFKAVAAGLKAKKELGKLMSQKDGWKTSEFWVNLIITLVTLFAGIMGMLPADIAAKVIMVLAAVYTISRTIAKLTPTKVDDDAIEKIGAVLKEKLGIIPKE